MKIVVVVESPSKAKIINKYLGNNYRVLASYGHVRDLPARDGSVNPQENFFMRWECSTRGQQQIEEIEKSLKNADMLYLATDPDREGEAISWHVKEILKNNKNLKNIVVKRIVFHEINKATVLKSMEVPRELDENLVHAYLARRALDYLVGFTLSSILWRKLPGSRSAGRVQSVALRLVCERESEIEKFISQEYWSIEGTFINPDLKTLKAKLVVFKGDKLEKFSITDAAQAQSVKEELVDLKYHVSSIEKKQVKRHPTPPFITSTLQQEAYRKLRFSAKKTMQIAQQLYEGVPLNGETTGLITYMRTDSTAISTQTITSIRSYVEQKMGKPYLHNSVRVFKSKSKNAQEAHEAIRPTQIELLASQLKNSLNDDQLKLYNLIWQRTVASQMSSAVFDQVTVMIDSSDYHHTFRASGTTLMFDGFLKIYGESKDIEENEVHSRLPILSVDMLLNLETIECLQHFTQPPYRFTEASLVKNLEELGIGRPSTYVSILSTLTERKYIRIEKSALMPEALGRVVTAFLENYFKRYVEYNFTAQLEDKLDDIANNTQDWHNVLSEFWEPFKQTVDGISHYKITDVINQLNDQLSNFLFPSDSGRKCLQCETGQLSLKLGRFGSFIGCSNYPDCNYTHKLSGNALTNEISDSEIFTEGGGKKVIAQEPKIVATDPNTLEQITLRSGPYGLYFQWGEKVGKSKPKRVPLPKGIVAEAVTLDQLLVLKSLPRLIGIHPDNNTEILASIGRFGPYLKYHDRFISLKTIDQLFNLDISQACEIIAKAPPKRISKSKK